MKTDEASIPTEARQLKEVLAELVAVILENVPEGGSLDAKIQLFQEKFDAWVDRVEQRLPL